MHQLSQRHPHLLLCGCAGDLKYHVHSFHAFGSHRSGDATFPGKLNNCESCHTKGQYNLPNQQNERPSLVATTADNKQPKFFSPTLVVLRQLPPQVAAGAGQAGQPGRRG